MSNDNIELGVYDLLKTVIDPELDVNVIDLGLIYKISYSEGEGVSINMTLSTPSCPMGDEILSNIKNVISEKYPGINVMLNLVWEPKWDPAFITPAGRQILGRA